VRQRLVVAVVLLVVLLAVAQLLAIVTDDAGPSVEPGLAQAPAMVRRQAPAGERTTDAYAGYGTWIDVYDFAPEFAGNAGPSLAPAVVDEMAADGIQTIYVQTGQLDERSPQPLIDPAVLGQFLVRAQRAGMKVVGWYLPRLDDIDADMAHLRAISDFEVLGHRFDGVAVDIEWTDSIADHERRSDALVGLSEQLREETDGDPLGAIVLPPLQIEVVNTRKWPDFPWKRLEPLYDVWLPMAYWTERKPESGLRNARTYSRENISRIRENLDDPDALVHVIGGLGSDVTAPQVTQFVDALNDMDAIGGSMYDWNTLPREHNPALSMGLAGD
jgi:hypothetical protein